MNELKMLIFLLAGTIGIAVFASWMLQLLGPPKNKKVNSTADSLSSHCDRTRPSQS